MVRNFIKNFNAWLSCLLILLFSLCGQSHAEKKVIFQTKGFLYSQQTKPDQTIHIFTMNPQFYALKIVKGHETVFGRETIEQFAERTNSLLTFNAGFFEIGNNQDGQPVGTLQSNNTFFSVAQNLHTLLLWTDDEAAITQATSTIHATHRDKRIAIHSLNKFAHKNKIMLYNHKWGTRTRTPYTRKEIVLDKAGNILDVIAHGDNAIPQEGWVLSLPAISNLSGFEVGQNINIQIDFFDRGDNLVSIKHNALQGIPLLVKDGKINPRMNELIKNTIFLNAPLARTAVGIKKNGDYIFIIVESTVVESFKTMTLKATQNLLREKYQPHEIYALKLGNVLQYLSDLEQRTTFKGLSLHELATLFVELGAEEAMNLDGGASTAFYLNFPPAHIFSYLPSKAVSNALTVQKRSV